MCALVLVCSGSGRICWSIRAKTKTVRESLILASLGLLFFMLSLLLEEVDLGVLELEKGSFSRVLRIVNRPCCLSLSVLVGTPRDHFVVNHVVFLLNTSVRSWLRVELSILISVVGILILFLR